MGWLARETHQVVEPSGAVAVAAARTRPSARDRLAAYRGIVERRQRLAGCDCLRFWPGHRSIRDGLEPTLAPQIRVVGAGSFVLSRRCTPSYLTRPRSSLASADSFFRRRERAVELPLVKRVEQSSESRTWLHAERQQVPPQNERRRRRVLDAERARALDEPVHRGAVESRRGRGNRLRRAAPAARDPLSARGGGTRRRRPRAAPCATCPASGDARRAPAPARGRRIRRCEWTFSRSRNAVGRRDACLLVIERADAAVENAVVAGLPKSWHTAPSITATCSACGRSSMRVAAPGRSTISVWTQTSPSGCHSGSCSTPDERPQLGPQPIDDAEVERQREADRRATAPGAAASRPRPRSVRPADRRAGSRGRARASPRRASSSKRAANCSARSTRRLSSPNVVGSTTRRRRCVQIAAAAERDRGLVGQRIPQDRVDGEVAPARRLRHRHRTDRPDDEAFVAAPALRLAARQRHIDRGPACRRGSSAPTVSTRPNGAEQRRGRSS